MPTRAAKVSVNVLAVGEEQGYDLHAIALNGDASRQPVREMDIGGGIARVQEQPGGRSRMMKGEPRLARAARTVKILIALALLLGLLLPSMEAAAQEEDADVPTTEALSEMPTTGARRPGPVVLAASTVDASTVAAPAPPPAPVEGVAPVELQVDSVGVD